MDIFDFDFDLALNQGCANSASAPRLDLVVIAGCLSGLDFSHESKVNHSQ